MIVSINALLGESNAYFNIDWLTSIDSPRITIDTIYTWLMVIRLNIPIIPPLMYIIAIRVKRTVAT